jgi:hypothetical protein
MYSNTAARASVLVGQERRWMRVLLERRVEAVQDGVIEAVAARSHRDVDADAAAAWREHQRRVVAGLGAAARDAHLERVDNQFCA